MAFEYGSSSLGIKNPFRTEGIIQSACGFIISLLGIYLLLKVPSLVNAQQMAQGWVLAGAGFMLLAWGLKQLGTGLFYVFRFFVGRSVPASLAKNYAKSETQNRDKEFLAYTTKDLESMLMGRKNITFTEPDGWLSRLIHSVLPKLLFLPYPIRNVAQDICGALIATAVALIVFGFAYFISLSGLVGEAGTWIIQVLSFVLLLHLTLIWRRLAHPVDLAQTKSLKHMGAEQIAKLIAVAILVPVLVGIGYNYLSQQTLIPTHSAYYLAYQKMQAFHTWPFLLLLGVLAISATALVMSMVLQRIQRSHPVTEVSEFRQNFQESIHPTEIFVNIDSIVLANRRYQEIPNRIYTEKEPDLKEQSKGKGSFFGEMIVETQPEFTPIEHSAVFKKIRLFTSFGGHALLLVVAVLFCLLAFHINSIIPFIEQFASAMQAKKAPSISAQADLIASLAQHLQTTLQWVIAVIMVGSFGKMLVHQARVFWSEMAFSSLLVYLKMEGTFSESLISTGTSIYDSTRSENTVVRSSITPWIISSRIRSSTFAVPGFYNLELPRYIMSMQANPAELDAMVDDIQAFLRDRESIAGLKNNKDLASANDIFQVNQQTRAMVNQNESPSAPKIPHEVAAASQLDQAPSEAS